MSRLPSQSHPSLVPPLFLRLFDDSDRALFSLSPWTPLCRRSPPFPPIPAIKTHLCVNECHEHLKDSRRLLIQRPSASPLRSPAIFLLLRPSASILRVARLVFEKLGSSSARTEDSCLSRRNWVIADGGRPTAGHRIFPAGHGEIAARLTRSRAGRDAKSLRG